MPRDRLQKFVEREAEEGSDDEDDERDAKRGKYEAAAAAISHCLQERQLQFISIASLSPTFLSLLVCVNLV
eukprot:CAMPEP_0178992452 /NCGR_PEP_ID=MMETSP0795-20121207/6121_1 /TAXON_ID=88552 /ORGANISM="Amoebophrya sp., Strain Ameob2" /LENGTH=70 /DNA_ID=CAMNT_0020684333 /DNA_START=299 /DNA_END=511 /DNA_ORIENTATION=-